MIYTLHSMPSSISRWTLVPMARRMASPDHGQENEFIAIPHTDAPWVIGSLVHENPFCPCIFCRPARIRVGGTSTR